MTIYLFIQNINDLTTNHILCDFDEKSKCLISHFVKYLCDDNYLIHICKQIGLGMNYRRIHSILGMGPNPRSKQTSYISVNITYVQDVPFQRRNPFVIIWTVVLKVGRCSGSANKNRQ